MTESIDILRRAMEERGYIFKSLHFRGGAKRFTQICNSDGHALLTLASGNPLYPFATSSSRLIARDKMTAYEFVAQNNVPVPPSMVVAVNGDYSGAQRSLEAYGTVVVKPVSGAGSAGLTLDVTTSEALMGALKTAWQGNVPAVVQQQFSGEEIRFTVVNGVVRSALLRQKPHVIGDGASTVAQLIVHENEQRRNIIDTLVSYPQLTGELIDGQVLEDQTVLADGETKELSKSTMIRGGASVYDILTLIHPSYIKAAEQAAYGLGKGFIVVDMMVQEYTTPAAADNHVFIEFNLAPALSLFYSCRDGRHVSVAEDFLVPMLEAVIKGQDNA